MIPDTLIETYCDRFVARSDVYYQQLTEPVYRYSAIWEKVDHALIARHLSGKITIGFPPMDADGMCKWAAWDCDDEKGHAAKLLAILSTLSLLPLQEGRRPGREGHIWLFFNDRLSAGDLLLFNRELLAHVGIPDGEVEFFPKQSEAKKIGNCLRGPLGIHRRPGANNERGWFEGPVRDVLDQLEWLAGQPLNSTKGIQAIAGQIRDNQRYVIKPFRKWTQESLDVEDILADLNPVCHGAYYSLDCPGCGQHTAYIYGDGTVLRCNRHNKCRHEVSVADWLAVNGKASA